MEPTPAYFHKLYFSCIALQGKSQIYVVVGNILYDDEVKLNLIYRVDLKC